MVVDSNDGRFFLLPLFVCKNDRRGNNEFAPRLATAQSNDRQAFFVSPYMESRIGSLTCHDNSPIPSNRAERLDGDCTNKIRKFQSARNLEVEKTAPQASKRPKPTLLMIAGSL